MKNIQARHEPRADRRSFFGRALTVRTQARIQARTKPRHGQSGAALMLEAVMMMSVILVTVTGFIGLNNNVNRAQRISQGTDIAAQASQGVLEKLDATAWDKIGMWSGPGGIGGDYSTTTYGGFPSVLIQGASRPNGVYQSGPSSPIVTPVTLGTGGTINVSSVVYVVWKGNCPTTCASTTPSSSYGTKRIFVVSTFTPPGQAQARTTTSYFDRTSRPTDASPVTLPAPATS